MFYWRYLYQYFPLHGTGILLVVLQLSNDQYDLAEQQPSPQHQPTTCQQDATRMCVNWWDFSNSKIFQTEKNKIHHQWPLSRGLWWVGSRWNRLCPAISWNILTVRPLALLRIVGGRFGICSTPNAPNPPGGGSRAGQREKEEGFQKGRLEDSEEASCETDEIHRTCHFRRW